VYARFLFLSTSHVLTCVQNDLSECRSVIPLTHFRAGLRKVLQPEIPVIRHKRALLCEASHSCSDQESRECRHSSWLSDLDQESQFTTTYVLRNSSFDYQYPVRFVSTLVPIDGLICEAVDVFFRVTILCLRKAPAWETVYMSF
jgi:hypothetical protein